MTLATITPSRSILHKRRHSPSPFALSSPIKRKRTDVETMDPRAQSNVPKSLNARRSTRVKAPTKHGSSLFNTLSDMVSVCAKHDNCAPVPRVTFTLIANAICEKLKDAARTICAVQPRASLAWCEGYVGLYEYGNGKGEWKECSICVMLELLLGYEGLPLMCGLMMLGMMDNYDRCLLGLRMYRSKEHVEKFDAMVKRYVEIHKTHII